MANLGYLQLTRDCLQNCRFCSNPPTGVDLAETEMRALVDELASMGYDGVILTGGEPTLSPLLFPAIAYAAERGLWCRMISNGQRLADPDFATRCVDAGLRHVHLSLHSSRPEVHDFITRYAGAFDALVRALEQLGRVGLTCDINTVINRYNADHLDETVRWIVGHFPFVRHFVWNNMDPDGNRAEQNPDCIHDQREYEGSLRRAMRYLHGTGRTFRAERVPLCFMREFAWASTETRKIVKEEERCIRFLDQKGFVHQLDFRHGKGTACDACQWDPICAGLFSMARTFDERELSPVFEPMEPVVRAVLGQAASPALMERLEQRRGQRWHDEQPDDGKRGRAKLRVLVSGAG